MKLLAIDGKMFILVDCSKMEEKDKSLELIERPTEGYQNELRSDKILTHCLSDEAFINNS
jgi:hypothetical protein